MEDFLKNRPVLDPKSALFLAADPKHATGGIKPPPATAGAGSAAAASPFAELRRDTGAAPLPAAKSGAKPGPGSAAGGRDASLVPQTAAQALSGEHGTKVQTIVERGRVTKIVVTCTCGKVTEIACQY